MQFDIFLSYNWDCKDLVKTLYEKLTTELNYKVWLDDQQLDSSHMLFEQLCEGIKNSKCILCCVTKKYTESDNCIREINFASVSRKPLIVLMLERLDISEIGSVGFIIAPLTRLNFYKEQNADLMWTGLMFESLKKSLQINLVGIQNENIKKLTKALGAALKFSTNNNSQAIDPTNLSVNENNKFGESNDGVGKEVKISGDDVKCCILQEKFGYYKGSVRDGCVKEGRGEYFFKNGDKYKGTVFH